MNYDKQGVSRLPEAAYSVLRYLQDQGKKTQKQLINELGLPTRKLRYTIRRLLERGLIKKVPNLKDMRSIFYLISPEVGDVETIIAEDSGMHASV